MHRMPEAGKSALILFTIFLPTSLINVFGVPLCGGGNFMDVLRVRAETLHFLQAEVFSHTAVILTHFSRFRKVAKSEY